MRVLFCCVWSIATLALANADPAHTSIYEYSETNTFPDGEKDGFRFRFYLDEGEMVKAESFDADGTLRFTSDDPRAPLIVSESDFWQSFMGYGYIKFKYNARHQVVSVFLDGAGVPLYELVFKYSTNNRLFAATLEYIRNRPPGEGPREKKEIYEGRIKKNTEDLIELVFPFRKTGTKTIVFAKVLSSQER